VEWQDGNVFVHGIECLSRIRFNGQNYAPEFIFNYAAEKLKLTNYDRICLMQALSLVPHDSQSLIFINVRPQTLIGDGFISWFRALLKQNQLLPEQIVIEVTEQYCNISEGEMSEQCKNLKKHGISLAIDDFGSGISNLSMLEVMKPRYIKISGRFIKNSHQDLSKQKIIKNVMALAYDFGIIPIVESVELEQEWLQARALGARLAQGFFFYKPMAKEELSALLKMP
jgi:EAL domain-containing protein (putative c-di-GMP-specific phosphodiesterase class I)